MSKQDDKQAQADDSQEVEVDEQFQSEAVAAFVDAVRDAWKQARKDKKKLEKADLIEVLSPQLAELDRAVSESTTELRGKVSDLAKLANQKSQDLNQLMGRLDRERKRLPAKAKEDFARAMLQVVDAVDGAYTTLEIANADPNVLQGIQMTSKLIDHAFESQGFLRIEALGSELDYDRHESLGEIESSDHAAGTVIEVLRSGYYFNETPEKVGVLRAAGVIVAKSPTTADEADGESAAAESESDLTREDAANTTNPQSKPAKEQSKGDSRVCQE